MTHFLYKFIKYHNKHVFLLVVILAMLGLVSPAASQDGGQRPGSTQPLIKPTIESPPVASGTEAPTSEAPASYFVPATPTPDTSSVRSHDAPPEPPFNGLVRFQNRATDNLVIQVRALSEDLHVLSATTVDDDGRYWINAPRDVFFWLEVDAPLHRLIRIGIEPGQVLPDITLIGGDLNDDGCVGPADLTLLVPNLDMRDTSQTDITGDGITDASDLAILAGNFQANCEALPPVLVDPIDPTPTVVPLAEVVTVPYADSFDSGQGWNPTGGWLLDSLTAMSGLSWFADGIQEGTLTFGSAIDLTADGDTELVFWQKGVGGVVEVSVDDGQTWEVVDDQAGALLDDWQLHSVALAAYRDQVIRLRFRLDVAQSGWWIDDLTLGPVVAVSDPTLTPTATESPTPTSTDPLAPTATDFVPPTATPVPVSLPFNESFDSGLGWTGWQIDGQTAHSGFSRFADGTQREQTSILDYDGRIDLTTAANPYLVFWQKALLAAADQVTVEISQDDGLSWLPVDQQIGLAVDWSLHEVDLTPYRGAVIQLRFRLDTSPDQVTLEAGYWLDDLLLQDTTPPLSPTPIPLIPDAPVSVTSTPLVLPLAGGN